jgi:hypothetical protein
MENLSLLFHNTSGRMSAFNVSYFPVCFMLHVIADLLWFHGQQEINHETICFEWVGCTSPFAAHVMPCSSPD